jgi:membrane protease subunit HflK
MAWNDPPGRDDDPWARGSQQGPPDLDEAFRKFQNKLTGMFGGGGSGAGGTGKGSFLNWKVISLGALAVAIGYLLLGVYQLDEQERGVVFRFGHVQDTVKLPGIRWNPPIIDSVTKVNVTRVDSHKHDALMLTEDENIVDISLTVQYKVDDPIAYEVEVRDPLTSLEHATSSALRHVVGSTTMDSVITEGRAALGLEVEDRIQRYLDVYGTGIDVVKVNLDRSAPPAQVQDAFDDVQKAKEDEVRAENVANAYAEEVIPQARGDAEKAVQEAEAYRDQVIARAKGEADRFKQLLAEYQLAPEVTRDRLFVDSMEAMLSQSSKTIVDVGDDNIMVLPLSRSDRSAAAADVLDTATLASVATRDRGATQAPVRQSR